MEITIHHHLNQKVSHLHKYETHVHKINIYSRNNIAQR